MKYTEDVVRDNAKVVLGFDDDEEKVQQGTGQITIFNQLGFKRVSKKPDGWYLPNNENMPAIILETKNSDEDLTRKQWVDELMQDVDIVGTKYKQVVGILYNGVDIRVYKGHEEVKSASKRLEHKNYYISLYTDVHID